MDEKWYFERKNLNRNRIYFENFEKYWSKRKYDLKGNIIYYQNSDGQWQNMNMIQEKIKFIGKILMENG